LLKHQTKVRGMRVSVWSLTKIAVSIFNNSEEAKRFNPAPGDEPGEGLITGCNCIRVSSIKSEISNMVAQ
jgi:hypothetical protein